MMDARFPPGYSHKLRRKRTTQVCLLRQMLRSGLTKNPNVFITHRHTAGLDSQSGFLHIHHIVSLQTLDDTDTVPSPEHITGFEMSTHQQEQKLVTKVRVETLQATVLS